MEGKEEIVSGYFRRLSRRWRRPIICCNTNRVMWSTHSSCGSHRQYEIYSSYLNFGNWQKNRTFEVATLTAQLEVESATIKSIFQRRKW